MNSLLREYQVAEFLGVSISWLQKGRVYGYGPAYVKLQRSGGAIRYRPEDVEAFLNEMRTYPADGGSQ